MSRPALDRDVSLDRLVGVLESLQCAAGKHWSQWNEHEQTRHALDVTDARNAIQEYVRAHVAAIERERDALAEALASLTRETEGFFWKKTGTDTTTMSTEELERRVGHILRANPKGAPLLSAVLEARQLNESVTHSTEEGTDR